MEKSNVQEQGGNKKLSLLMEYELKSPPMTKERRDALYTEWIKGYNWMPNTEDK